MDKKPMRTKFWEWKKVPVKNEASDEESLERVLFLNGTIAPESWFDDDVTPQAFKDELNAGTGDIVVWINSQGGDCVAAAQIYNMLMDYKGNVTVKIDGLAASAGSVIAMAGTNVQMSPVALMMIHNPATMAYGDKNTMNQAIAMLDSVKDSIINAYEIKTGLSRNKLSKLMDQETWMDAREAVKLGFADNMLGNISIDNKYIPEPVSMASQTQVNNCLMDRIADACKIKSKQEEMKNDNKTPVAALQERLDLIKSW